MKKPFIERIKKSKYSAIADIAMGQTGFIPGNPNSVQATACVWGNKLNRAFRTCTAFSVEHQSIGCWVTRVG
jgi:hypothetical protein